MKKIFFVSFVSLFLPIASVFAITLPSPCTNPFIMKSVNNNSGYWGYTAFCNGSFVKQPCLENPEDTCYYSTTPLDIHYCDTAIGNPDCVFNTESSIYGFDATPENNNFFMTALSWQEMVNTEGAVITLEDTQGNTIDSSNFFASIIDYASNKLPVINSSETTILIVRIIQWTAALLGVFAVIAGTKLGFKLIKKAFPNAY